MGLGMELGGKEEGEGEGMGGEVRGVGRGGEKG